MASVEYSAEDRQLRLKVQQTLSGMGVTERVQIERTLQKARPGRRCTEAKNAGGLATIYTLPSFTVASVCEAPFVMIPGTSRTSF